MKIMKGEVVKYQFASYRSITQACISHRSIFMLKLSSEISA